MTFQHPAGLLYVRGATALGSIARALPCPPTTAPKPPAPPTLRTFFAAGVSIGVTCEGEEAHNLPAGFMWGSPPRNGTVGGDDTDPIQPPEGYHVDWEEEQRIWAKLPNWGSDEARWRARLCKRAHTILHGTFLVDPHV